MEKERREIIEFIKKGGPVELIAFFAIVEHPEDFPDCTKGTFKRAIKLLREVQSEVQNNQVHAVLERAVNLIRRHGLHKEVAA